jgi:hypothetical protein
MAILIYHITHVKNLARIIQTEGLWCDAERLRQGFGSVGIAHQSLKDRRARTPVRSRDGHSIAAGGMLADYVPFYFANRSPMLFSIKTGHVAGYDGAQSGVVYLVTSVERVARGDRRWCFTDGHAVEAMTEFFDCADALNKVDWVVVKSWSWKNTEADPDRKRREQAEFLVHGSAPWNWIEQIGVYNGSVRRAVQEVLAAEQPSHQPPVSVQAKWYYES